MPDGACVIKYAGKHGVLRTGDFIGAVINGATAVASLFVPGLPAAPIPGYHGEGLAPGNQTGGLY